MQLRSGLMAGFVALGACSADVPGNGAQNKVAAAAPSRASTPLAAPAPVAGRSGTRGSRYTKLVETRCRLIDENKEEGPWWSRLCPGHAGWQLEWHESDLRQDLTLIGPDGRKSELGLSSIVANGAFNSIGPTIEWRGTVGARPDAMILRMSVAASPEGDRPDISRLVIVRLTKPPCVVSVVPPGPAQNARARQIADGKLPACLSAG